jgi:ribosomal protein S18 acetylase RimI-like enzyme
MGADELINMDISIEPLTGADQDFISEMSYHAIFIPPGSKPLPETIIHHLDLVKYHQHWGRGDDFGLAAVEAESNNKIGAVWIRRFTADHKGYGYIDDHTPELSIAVLPSYRGKGIGSMLLREIIKAVKNKYKALSLSVATANPAVALYKRFGFTIVSEMNETLTMKINLNHKMNGLNI